MSLISLPGLIDPHVHLRDPGQTEKEDFLSGTRAALAGGYTTILDMPNNIIPITTAALLDEKISIAHKKIVCDVGFYFGSTGDNSEEFQKIARRVKGLKLFLNKSTGKLVVEKSRLHSIFKSWPIMGGPILLHAEEDIVDFAIEVVQTTNKPTHFCHVADSHSMQLIINAKEKGLPITCGVTPHHLFLSTEDEKALGPLGKMKPPLQNKKDVDFLWNHLNVIDVIESDHAPHKLEQKKQIPTPYGVPGLETTLSLLLTAWSEKRITLEDIVRLTFENPKKIFNIAADSKTKIIIDSNATYTVDNKKLLTKTQWSPFSGYTVKGKVMSVFIRGVQVYQNGEVLVKPGFGKIIN